MEMMGFEPMTPCLQGRCSPNWATPPRTVSASILGLFSFTRVFYPEGCVPLCLTLSSICGSSFLLMISDISLKIEQQSITSYTPIKIPSCLYLAVLLRKEVIQPHLPIRLPCYDLTPIIEPTFDSCLLAVSSLASGVPNFHGLTGGVYKARERIHRGMLIRDY